MIILVHDHCMWPRTHPGCPVTHQNVSRVLGKALKIFVTIVALKTIVHCHRTNTLNTCEHCKFIINTMLTLQKKNLKVLLLKIHKYTTFNFKKKWSDKIYFIISRPYWLMLSISTTFILSQSYTRYNEVSSNQANISLSLKNVRSCGRH